MQLLESLKLAHVLLDEHYKELMKSDTPQNYQVNDSRSNVLFKLFGDKLSMHNVDKDKTSIDRFYLNAVRNNDRYTKAIEKNPSLVSKARAIVFKDKADEINSRYYSKSS